MAIAVELVISSRRRAESRQAGASDRHRPCLTLTLMARTTTRAVYEHPQADSSAPQRVERFTGNAGRLAEVRRARLPLSPSIVRILEALARDDHNARHGNADSRNRCARPAPSRSGAASRKKRSIQVDPRAAAIPSSGSSSLSRRITWTAWSAHGGRSESPSMRTVMAPAALPDWMSKT